MTALLLHAGLDAPTSFDLRALREATLDRLADTVDAHMDTAVLGTVFGIDACRH